jgi:hypothetical protein
MRISRYAFAFFGPIVGLAGCSGFSSPTDIVTTSAGQAAAESRLSMPGSLLPAIPMGSVTKTWMSANASRAGSIYVTGVYDGCITIYPLRGHHQSPKGQICGSPLGFAVGLAVDRHRNLWVGDVGNNQILCYPPGETTPTKVLTDSGYYPEGIAVDKAGTLFVANSAEKPSGTSTVAIYARGSNSPTQVLSDPQMNGQVGGVAIDKARDIFVSFGFPAVVKLGEFTRSPSGTYAFSIIATPGGIPTGLQMDNSGNLLAANQSAQYNQTVSVFSPPAWNMTNNFGGNHAGNRLALDEKDEHVFTTETFSQGSQAGSIVEFSYPAGKKVNHIDVPGPENPIGIAVSPASVIGP